MLDEQGGLMLDVNGSPGGWGVGSVAASAFLGEAAASGGQPRLPAQGA